MKSRRLLALPSDILHASSVLLMISLEEALVAFYRQKLAAEGELGSDRDPRLVRHIFAVTGPAVL